MTLRVKEKKIILKACKRLHSLLTSYLLLESWVSKHGQEPMLPGLNFSPNQLFWISGASVWCAKQRPGDLRMSVMLGTHTPADYRIKVSVFFNNYPFHSEMVMGSNSINEKG